MRFRIRGPTGVSTCSLPEENATIAQLRKEISDKTELPTFDLKIGYPPQPLDLDQFDDSVQISDAGIKLNGEQLIAIRKDIAEPLKHPVGTSQPTAAPTAQPQPKPSTATDPSTDPPEIPVPSHNATLVLRVMPDDNSCLFRAFGFAYMGDGFDVMYELRSLIATTIQQNPELYSAAVLDKEPTKYCQWITREDAWGGAIELGILAQNFDVEICSINVQDGRVDRFNEGDFKKKVILIYSGIHYDCVALSPSEPPHTKADVPAELDRRVFEPGDDIVLTKALELCKVLKNRHYYTDTAGFSIRCNTCGWTGTGEKGAQQHAMSTGHTDFGEAN